MFSSFWANENCDIVVDFSFSMSPETEIVKTVVMKGKAPVDSECKAKLGKVKLAQKR